MSVSTATKQCLHLQARERQRQAEAHNLATPLAAGRTWEERATAAGCRARLARAAVP